VRTGVTFYWYGTGRTGIDIPREVETMKSGIYVSLEILCALLRRKNCRHTIMKAMLSEVREERCLHVVISVMERGSMGRGFQTRRAVGKEGFSNFRWQGN
jgi:hypothetical protein